MKNKGKLTLCLAALAILTACSLNWNKIRGSGIIKTESREVTSFSAIAFKSVGKLRIQQIGKESLTIIAEDNILPTFESRVSGQTLYISSNESSSIDPTQPIEFVVEVKSLQSLDINGVGSIEVKDIQGKRLSVSLDGVGSVAISGKVDVLELNLDGVGSFNGTGLKAKQAKVQNKGVGNAVVNASEELDATVLGIGSIEYIGSPQIKESVKGMGVIKKKS